MSKSTSKKSWLGLALWVVAGAVTTALADSDIGTLATNVQGTLGPIETMIVAVCYIGGVAFAGAAIMKFKQYKDNPQSVTLGQPIALLFIAAALIWLPQIVKTTGQTIFKSSTSPGGVKNTGIFQ